MAGGGEKKRLKEATSTRSLYTNITIALYIVWFTVRVLWQFSSFTRSTVFGLVFLSLVNWLCLSSIFQALAMGTPFTAYQDVLFINWAVMALSLVTSYAWWVWMIIPTYVMYQYGGTILGWVKMAMSGMRGGGGGEGGDVSEVEKKRLAKKERQAERQAKLSQGRS